MMNFWNGSPFLFPLGFGFLFFVVLIITVILKGFALWHSARRGEKWWFIILLVVNTLGILELIYLFAVVGSDWYRPGSGNSSDKTKTPETPAPQA